MADEKENREADRFASGTGAATGADSAANDDMLPGVTGGGTTYVPDTGGSGSSTADAASVEGTIGAVGEMDITGAPAGTSGASTISGQSAGGETSGGGPGGGSVAGGGTGPAPSGPGGPQSAQSTLDALGDRELASGGESGGAGSMGGAGGTGGAGGSDVAPESGTTNDAGATGNQ